MNNKVKKTVVLIFVSNSAIFITDALLPIGYAIYLFYLAPILLSFSLPAKNAPYAVMAFVTILVLTGIAFKKNPGAPAIIPTYIVLFNRIIAIMCGWTVAALLKRHKATVTDLAKSRDEIRLIMDSGPTLISYVDAGCRYVRVNKNYEGWFGYTQEQIRGKHLREVVGELTWRAVKPHVERVLAGEAVTFEQEESPREGVTHWVRATFTPDRDESGILGFVVHALNMDVSKKAESALRDSEEKYRELFTMANDAIFLLKDEIFIDCNPKALAMFECTREQVIGQPLHIFFPTTQPDGSLSRDKGKEKMEMAFKGEPRFFDWVHTRYNGAPFDAEVSLNCIRLKGEKYLQAMIRDVTERKQAEAAVRLSEARFRTLFEQSPVSIQILSPDGRTLEVNHAFEALWGLTVQKLENYNILEDNQLAAKEIMSYIRKGFSGEATDIPIILYDPANIGLPGHPSWVKGFIYPVRDESTGNIPQVVLMHVDVTELINTQEALRDSRQRLQAVMDNSPAVIYMKDTLGHYLLINRKFEEILHVNNESFIGKTDNDIYPLTLAKTIQSNDKKVLESRKAFEYEESIPLDDGAHTFISIKYPLFDAQGFPYAVCGISTDITERKREEKLRLQAYEELEAALREKEILLQEIHHRVKNNLQIVFSLLNLQAGLVTDPHARMYFHESQNRVKSMALIHETLYRGDNLTELDFQRYVRELVRFLQNSNRPTSDRIALRIDVEKKPLPLDTAIPCGLILTELVSNAFKYAFPGETTGTVVIEARQETTGEFLIRVADDGQGLPPDLDYMHSPSLGLQLVTRLAVQLNAVFERESTDRGTSFILKFKDHPDG